MKVELIVLGLLMEKDLHGYEIKKEVLERSQGFLDVAHGSVYYAIKSSLKKGWIQKVGTEKKGDNPERNIFQIMPEGKTHFKKMLKKYLNHTLIQFNINIILMYFNSLDDIEKEAFIQERRAILEEKKAAVKKMIEKNSGESGLSSKVHFYRYIENLISAELAFVKQSPDE